MQHYKSKIQDSKRHESYQKLQLPKIEKAFQRYWLEESEQNNNPNSSRNNVNLIMKNKNGEHSKDELENLKITGQSNPTIQSNVSI